jgi:hypothetical protein
MGLIEGNSDSIAHLILDEADLEFSGFTMTTANNKNINLSPWKPGQNGNPSGRPKGTRDLAGYALETTDGGKELVDALVVSIARGVMPNVAAQEGSRLRKDQQVRPADQLKAIEMLLDRGFGRSPQQLDVAHSVSDRPLAHLSDETLRLLVENARQLEEGSGVVVDGDGQAVIKS